MTAADWLKRINAEHELLPQVARYIPRAAANPLVAGSELAEAWGPELRDKLGALDGLTVAEAGALSGSRSDWLSPLFEELRASLPSGVRELVTPSDRFAIGVRPTGRLNADASGVPER